MAQRFTPDIPVAEWEHLKDLVKSTRPLRDTYEGRTPALGVSREWMQDTMAYWVDGYDWPARLERIKSVDHYMMDVKGRSVHFVGHFSKDPAAIPLLLLHGWPGTFLEFIDVVKILRESTSPAFSIVVPSQPGFLWSEQPPLDKDYTLYDVAELMNDLMLALGFTSYAAQGGDIGSVIARILAVKYPTCAAINVNFLPLWEDPSGGNDLNEITDVEAERAGRYAKFFETGRGYSVMHATKPATIGFAIQASPVALLAWIGEKWSQGWRGKDTVDLLDTILDTITLWWLLETFPTSTWPYRYMPRGAGGWHADPALFVHKPMGFSSFEEEISSAPRLWAARTGNLQFYNYHPRGGHHAAGDQPQMFAEDMKACFAQIFPVRS